MQGWLVWSTRTFVVATLATLALFFTERDTGSLVPTWISGAIVWAALLALPGAVVGVIKRSDTRSRLLWSVLLVLIVALAGAMLFFVR